MDQILLKPYRSDLVYKGYYRAPALGLLAQPIPLIASVLKHLGKYGVGLSNLRWDTATLADTHLAIHLLDLNIMFLIRLDRLEAHFFKLHEVGIEAAHKMILDLALVVQERDSSLQFGRHEFNVGFDANASNAKAGDFFQRYITLPNSLHQVRPGLVLSLDGTFTQGLEGGSVVIVPMPSQEQVLQVRVIETFNADQLPLEKLCERGEDDAKRVFTALDLSIEGLTRT